jgi:hypothetical protein
MSEGKEQADYAHVPASVGQRRARAYDHADWALYMPVCNNPASRRRPGGSQIITPRRR